MSKLMLDLYDKDLMSRDAEPINSKVLDCTNLRVVDGAKIQGVPLKRDENNEYLILRLTDGATLIYPNSRVDASDEYGIRNRRCIAVYPDGTPKRARLERVAQLLNGKTGTDNFRVAETYFDYGQDWSWTTVLCATDSSFTDEYQYLYPAAQEKLLYCAEDVLEAKVDEILEEHKRKFKYI